jgi:putative SOS response-associated peptidase YedK
LTKKSTPHIEHIHHRNPIILTLQDVKIWFASEFVNLFGGTDNELMADIV